MNKSIDWLKLKYHVVIPGVPGIGAFIDYDVEPEIFCRFFGYVLTN